MLKWPGLPVMPRAVMLNLRQQYAFPFLGTYLLCFIVYTYLFSSIIFTNHTLPNAWLYSYPSFKTWYEGRWFADFLIFIFGGSGVQSLQMFLATGIQVTNGLLFCRFLNVTDRFFIFLITSFLALHPAFLDYYSFTVDNIEFTFGDSLALIGVLTLDCLRYRYLGATICTACFVLTIATYQPKIALVAALLIIWCIKGAVSEDDLPRQSSSGPIGTVTSLGLDRILISVIVFLSAIGLYFLSLLATIRFDQGNRNHINDVGHMLWSAALSYAEVIRDFTSRVDYLPHIFRPLPAAIIIGGIITIVWGGWVTYRLRSLPAVFTLFLLPPALQLSYIINDRTWEAAGRILSPQAYVFAFFLVSLWSHKVTRALAVTVTILMVYFFCIVGSQESNSAEMNMLFDVNKINRIVSRIEDVVPDLYARHWPVVVVGDFSNVGRRRFTKYRNSLYSSQKAHPFTSGEINIL